MRYDGMLLYVCYLAFSSCCAAGYRMFCFAPKQETPLFKMTPVLDRLTVFIPRPHFALSLSLFFFSFFCPPLRRWPPNNRPLDMPLPSPKSCLLETLALSTNHTGHDGGLPVGLSASKYKKKKKATTTTVEEPIAHWKTTIVPTE